MLGEGRFALDDPIVACAPELARLRVLRDPDGPLDHCDNATQAITFNARHGICRTGREA